MPSDDTRAGHLYTSTRPRPQRPSTFPISTRKLLLLLAFTALYSLFAIHNDLPPWSWIENYKHRHDKVVLHRPAFKKVERYSPEHRYRPAASPVIKKVGKDGRVKEHGRYH